MKQSVNVSSCFSDRSGVRGHADRDHVDGIREGESGGCATGQFQQPPQSCGVPPHCTSLLHTQTKLDLFREHLNSSAERGAHSAQPPSPDLSGLIGLVEQLCFLS